MVVLILTVPQALNLECYAGVIGMTMTVSAAFAGSPQALSSTVYMFLNPKPWAVALNSQPQALNPGPVKYALCLKP